MAVLAKAPEELLEGLWSAAGITASFEWLLWPETGAVMVRGRTGGTGAPFNLGEMTVTRCALRLAGGDQGGVLHRGAGARLMDGVLQGGFADRPRQSAAAFRAALDALARPGRIHDLAGAQPPEGLSVAAGVLLLTLADAETPLWLPDRLRGCAVAEWLRFHSNAPAAAGRGQAAFAVGQWEELLPLKDWPAGDPAYPDRAATLIVEMPALAGGPEMALTGPGIETPARLAPALPPGAAEALRWNAGRFPLGVDVFFTAGARLAGLPRSTRIGG